MPGKKIKIIIVGLLFLLILSSALFLRQQYVVPILMYHQVFPGCDPKYPLAVSDAIFERQMKFLKENHYNVMRLDELADFIRNKRKLPPKACAVTFDDGYRNNFTYAFPILKKYNIPATIFLIFNETNRPQGDRLSWEEIYIMRDSGLISFGSHALAPEPLVNIKPESELRRQIFDSKKLLEEKLNSSVSGFSYPEGLFNQRIKELVMQAGYKFAVATNPGKSIANNDIFALKRLRISDNCRNLAVFWAEISGYYNFMREHKRKRHNK
jgi:peptidoglycan/xylan/chitin deacetylase (PgdA/CDA1 family)